MNNLKSEINYINKHTNNKFTFTTQRKDNDTTVIDVYLNGKFMCGLTKYNNSNVDKKDLDRVVNKLNNYVHR